MLRAILNKSWRQHLTMHQLYSHLPPITKTIQVRRSRHAGHWWRSRDELISDVLLWTPTHMAEQKQDDQLEHTYSSYMRIRDVALKTCRRRWTIGRSGERGSRISVQAARHDDGIYIYIYIYIYIRSMTNDTCWRSKDVLISDGLLWTRTREHASVSRPANLFTLALCGYSR